MDPGRARGKGQGAAGRGRLWPRQAPEGDDPVQHRRRSQKSPLAVAVQQFWKQIGVQVELANYEWKVHTDRLQNQDFEVARYAWCADLTSPRPSSIISAPAATTTASSRTPITTRRWKKPRPYADPAPLVQKAEEILIGNMALVPVYHYAKPMMVRSPDLRGWPKANVMNDWRQGTCIAWRSNPADVYSGQTAPDFRGRLSDRIHETAISPKLFVRHLFGTLTMFGFILRRLAVAIPTLLLLIVCNLSFLLMYAAPGGPFTQERALPPPQVLANLNAKYGLNDRCGARSSTMSGDRGAFRFRPQLRLSRPHGEPDHRRRLSRSR